MNLKPKYLIPVLTLLFLACHSTGMENYLIPPKPDYRDPIYWFLDPAEQTSRAVDIFYVYPTLGFSSDTANPAFLADITRQESREAAFSNQRFNHQVYAGDEYNFFAPFYRQRTMNALTGGPGNAEQIMQVPVSDIATAFHHYMTHYNQGRPFMLLGHSQGSAVLLELLKYHMDQEHHEQMVAAYLIGWQITGEDLEEFPDRLIPARGSDDTGVIIMFNSLTTLKARSPRIDRSVVCINPLNWKTDPTMATREEHLGIVRFNRETRQYDTIPHFTGAYIQDHYLICTDVDPSGVFNEDLKDLFPFGNLHFMDSWLYALNLKANMAERVGVFLSN
jgi:pimeloyl-ACP methyl ester carboxylesterase